MIRILHCPDIVGGNPQGLARAERELGLDSWAVAFRQTIFSYSYDEILLRPSDGNLANMFAIWRIFWRGMYGYDFIHYNFGHTIFPTYIDKDPNSGFLSLLARSLRALFHMADLPIFHAVGKGIAVTFQGDDARQGDFSLKKFEISIAKFVDSEYYTPKRDAEKRRIIAKFDRFADLIYYTNPDLGHILPTRAKFFPYAHIDLREWKAAPLFKGHRPLVVHAPSHREAKGTEVIVQMVEHLKNDGVDFDFRLVEGIPNNEARRIYEQADLLIDQLYAGWYGGLSVELMALGRPVISYIRESDLKFIPEKMRWELPVINATAETLYDVLKHWLKDRRGLMEAGIRSRSYVENWHNPLVIAAQTKKDYVEVLSKKPVYRLLQRIRLF